MEKDNPLLPFAFTRSTSNVGHEVHLDTTPRSREVIDENARSMYHTRTPEHKRVNRPVLASAPSLKRRMGDSFNQKDDIKRRVTVFEDPESEEPTMIDTTSTDFIEDMGKENFGHLPSSPPIDTHLNSEIDTEFNVPLSPIQRLPSEPHSDLFLLQRLESETDFGIDKFNRFRPSGNQCPSTDRDISSSMVDDEERQRFLNAKAREIVIDAFEEMKTSIDLEGMGLTEVPHEIKDLNNLVVFGGTQCTYQLYLTNNKIRFLSPSLFKFTKLHVLALRQNKLERIPALIKNMVNLTDLSVGSNRLKFLPYQILDLPSLTTFRAGPNPFYKVPDDAIMVTTETLNPIKNKKYIGKIKYFKDPQKLMPSLRSLSLSSIAKYDVSYQETKVWKKHTPRVLHPVIIDAISQGNYQETCSECSRLLTEVFAEVIEWWDILQNKNIPVKREFCSGMCALKYKIRSLDSIDD